MICNLLVLIMDYLDISVVYRTIFLIPSVALTNIMACRVFRHTKLGHNTEIHTVSAMFPQSKRTVPIFMHTQRDVSTPGSIPRSEICHTSNISEADVPSSGNSAEKLPRFSKEEV
jgi:hypothetical protein